MPAAAGGVGCPAAQCLPHALLHPTLALPCPAPAPPQLLRNAVRAVFTSAIILLDFMVRGGLRAPATPSTRACHAWARRRAWGASCSPTGLPCRAAGLHPPSIPHQSLHYLPPALQIMLIVMTFNVGLILSATLGYGLGALAFGARRRQGLWLWAVWAGSAARGSFVSACMRRAPRTQARLQLAAPLRPP